MMVKSSVRRAGWFVLNLAACLGGSQLLGCDPVNPACGPEACRGEYSLAHECQEDYCREVDKPASVKCDPQSPGWLTSHSADKSAVLGVLIDGKNPNQSEARSRIIAEVVARANSTSRSLEIGLLNCSYEVSSDETKDQEVLADISDYLTQLGVAAVVGPSSSYASGFLLTSRFPALTPEFVMVSPSATLPNLQDDDAHGRFFRTTPADTAQLDTLSRAIMGDSDLGAILPLVQSDEYATSLSDAIKEAVPGGRVLDRFEFDDLKQATDRERLAEHLKRQPAGLLLIARDGTQITELFEWLIDNPQHQFLRIYVADGAANDPTIAPLLEQSCVDGEYCMRDIVVGTRPQVAGRETFSLPEFADDYEPFVYDAAWLLVYALHYSHEHGAPGVRATEVREALDSLLQAEGTESYRVLSDRQQILREIAMSDFAGVDLDGYTGSLDFLADGDVQGAFELWHLVDGKRQPFLTGVVDDASP